MPMDGVTLTEALHQHGINIRYMGAVLEYIEKIPQKERLDHVYVSVYFIFGFCWFLGFLEFVCTCISVAAFKNL